MKRAFRSVQTPSAPSAEEEMEKEVISTFGGAPPPPPERAAKALERTGLPSARSTTAACRGA